jgi:hypothetical protein
MKMFQRKNIYIVQFLPKAISAKFILLRLGTFPTILWIAKSFSIGRNRIGTDIAGCGRRTIFVDKKVIDWPKLRSCCGGQTRASFRYGFFLTNERKNSMIFFDAFVSEVASSRLKWRKFVQSQRIILCKFEKSGE